MENTEKTRIKTDAPSGIESTPIKFCKKTKDRPVDIIMASNGQKTPDPFETLKEIVGVKDSELALNIMTSAASAINVLYPNPQDEFGKNIVAQTLHDMKPKDVVEARFAAQSAVLYSHGISNIKCSEAENMIPQGEYYFNKGIKLLRLHNETIEALNRYRRGGEQKVSVTHSVLVNQATVNFNGGGGETTKNGGNTPCSSQNAEQKPELMITNPVANQQWQTENADFTAERAQDQKPK